MTTTLLLLTLGLCAGVFGGLLGIAGSILMIPGLDFLLGASQFHLHQAAAMLVNVLVVAPAALQHHYAGAVQWPLVRWTAPGAAIGALCGVFLANVSMFRGSGQGWLQLLFALVLAYAIAANARRMWVRRHAGPRPESAGTPRFSRATAFGLIGLPTGGLGGLLGVGGGLVAVPLQQLLLDTPLRNAIANSAATILWSVTLAAAFKNATLAGHGLTFAMSAKLAILLAPGALLGGWLGGWLVHRWPLRWVRSLLILLLSAAAVQLVLSGLSNVRGE